MTTLKELRGAVEHIKWVQAMTEARPPNTLVLSMSAAVAIDRLRVRLGLMPITPAGAKYARRRRRVARKKRRGW